MPARWESASSKSWNRKVCIATVLVEGLWRADSVPRRQLRFKDLGLGLLEEDSGLCSVPKKQLGFKGLGWFRV